MLSIVNEVDPLIFHYVYFVCNTNHVFPTIGHLTLFDFITNPRLKKNVIFPNLTWLGKKILILEFGSLVTCKEGIRHPTTPIHR